MITEESRKSEECYAAGKMRFSEDGETVLNELGKPAKKGDVVFRAENGFPLLKMGENGEIIDRRKASQESE